MSDNDVAEVPSNYSTSVEAAGSDRNNHVKLPFWKITILSKLDLLCSALLQEEDQPISSSYHTAEIDRVSGGSNNLDGLRTFTVAIVGAGIGILIILGPRLVLQMTVQMILRILGIVLGVGLGLGLATHISDLLSFYHQQSRPLLLEQQQNSSETQQRTIHAQHSLSVLQRQKSLMTTNALLLEEPYSYDSLMHSAGFHTATGAQHHPVGEAKASPLHFNSSIGNNKTTILRGQVLRSDDPFFTTYYRFNENSKAVTLFGEYFPVLPEVVRNSLSQFVELILRDFVACWYHKIDCGCQYPVTPDLNDKSSQSYPRRMVYRTGSHRRIPCMEKIYESTVIFAGGLATRVEHVNVLRLVLLQWTKVFAHTFKVYRALRKSLVLKHQQQNRGRSSISTVVATASQSAGGNPAPQSSASTSNSSSASSVHISETSMTKEFLLAGKLHRAITFGMDIPSILFADANAKETGYPHEEVALEGDETASRSLLNTVDGKDEEQILKQRLDIIIAENELDYLRVLSHRMVRALLPRNDFNCQILSSLMIEIISGCVLSPLLQTVASPEYINSWIIMGLGVAKESQTKDAVPPSATSIDDKTTSMASTSRTVSSTPILSSMEESKIALNDGCATTVLEENVVDDIVGKNFTNKDNAMTTPAVEATSIKVNLTVDTSSKSDINVPSLPLSLPSSKRAPDSASTSDSILMLFGLALIELQRYVDLDEPGRIQSIDWDNSMCRAVVLKLVLVIEAAMMDGRCIYKMADSLTDNDTIDSDDEEDDDEIVNGGSDDGVGPVEVMLPEYEPTTLPQLLMEMTSDVDAFEERVIRENLVPENRKQKQFNDTYVEDYTPTSTEQSTLRTLIAAWLHAGQIYRIVTVLVHAHASVLLPYYRKEAFLRIPTYANSFIRKLKALDGIEILVDTMAVLAAPRLHDTNAEELAALVHKSSIAYATPNSAPQTPSSRDDSNQLSSLVSIGLSSSSTPRYLDFNRNEAFASSLRSERERRMHSWEAVARDADPDSSPLQIVYRSRGATPETVAQHKELHNLARFFYGSTNIVTVRDAARRTIESVPDGSMSVESDTTDPIPVSLLTIETVSPRRRIEIPDDDSSFLLRAQPRPLNAIGVHRDQRNHDQSFKCFAATYEEPILNSRPVVGRFIRRCQVRYYPIDRTASVALQSNEGRRLDQRRNRVSIPNTITVGQSSRSIPFLPNEFLRERHLCQRWIPRGTTRTQSLLSSSVMEPTDFNSMPRSGRAIDFVYRLCFFERPIVDLAGKHFTIQDSSSLGSHRADASLLEMSDATLSFSLLILGNQERGKEDDSVASKSNIDIMQDGYPVIWMQFNRKEEEKLVEVKPYRISTVRAALLLTEARQEAQLQNLLNCVRTGSVKKATKSLTESMLKPTTRLLEFAGSKSREQQSLLLRDLKLGVNHIDREQLRRNGLLNPRSPTMIREFNATLEEAVLAHEIQGVELFGATGTLFKIRCIAFVEIVADDFDFEGDEGYATADGSLCESALEEWVVYRTFKDFQAFHKHIKNQVSVTESSGTAGSRLVGAATAAFATANGFTSRIKQREPLIPSLAQASKSGTLGMAKKSTEKRMEALDAYLKQLLIPGHLLSRSAELLLFLGASFPLPADLRPGCVLSGLGDPLGRTEMKRTIIKTRAQGIEPASTVVGDQTAADIPSHAERSGRSLSSASIVPSGSLDEYQGDDVDVRESIRKSGKHLMIPSIGCKIEKIHLSQFRHRVFELIRYLFGFDNASFVRNRMLAALKTASFAVTSNSEFQRTLYNIHTDHLNSESLSDWIKFVVELLWPNGEFFSSSPPTSDELLKEQSMSAKEALHSSFPEQLRAILGHELTKDGLDIFHEMLQNRVVMKSVGYMLFDLLWLEVFPEIGDVLDGGSVLDIVES